MTLQQIIFYRNFFLIVTHMVMRKRFSFVDWGPPFSIFCALFDCISYEIDIIVIIMNTANNLLTANLILANCIFNVFSCYIPFVGPHPQSIKSGHGCTWAVFGNEAFQHVQLSNITGQYEPINNMGKIVLQYKPNFANKCYD